MSARAYVTVHLDSDDPAAYPVRVSDGVPGWAFVNDELMSRFGLYGSADQLEAFAEACLDACHQARLAKQIAEADRAEVDAALDQKDAA